MHDSISQAFKINHTFLFLPHPTYKFKVQPVSGITHCTAPNTAALIISHGHLFKNCQCYLFQFTKVLTLSDFYCYLVKTYTFPLQKNLAF